MRREKTMQQTPQTRTPYEQTQLARYGVAHPELLLQEDAPVEYITGVCESNGLLFQVSPDVLIPRIETQRLADLVVKKFLFDIKSRPVSKISIIDIGTGSGFLGISVAHMISKALPQTQNIQIALTLCDISPAALTIAQKNASTLLGNSVEVKYIESDLLASVSQDKAPQFDIILANLPYIPSAQISELETSVKSYEPLLALDGGPDGFALISRLLGQAPSFMNHNSRLWLEVDPTHTVDMCQKAQPNLEYRAHKDSFGRHRFIEAVVQKDS